MVLERNKLIFCIGAFLAIVKANFATGQVVQSVGEAKKSSVRVYISDFPDTADLHVFVVTSKKQAIGNQGLWYFQDSQTYAQKKIFFVEEKSAADLSIYFVEEKSQAGWINNRKMKLFE